MIQSLTEKLGKSGNSIYDDGVREFLALNIRDWFADAQTYSEMVNPAKFVATVKNWIGRTELNEIKGLETFPLAVPSLGVTQALDQFHYRILLEKRTLRMFRGEYPYNRDVAPFHASDFLDERPLRDRDAVVISFPFSGSGDRHPEMLSVLDEAHKLNVPVFIDCAWFGTCGGLKIDLSHPGISEVAFSLSKGLTCDNYRSGIRLSRSAPQRGQDRLLMQNEWKHGIHLNAFIGTKICKKEEFGPDRQFKKFRRAQTEVCDLLGLEPSPCVHIATGKGLYWDAYSRDGAFNRVNLREAIRLYIKIKKEQKKSSSLRRDLAAMTVASRC